MRDLAPLPDARTTNPRTPRVWQPFAPVRQLSPVEIARLTWQQQGIRDFDRELQHHLRHHFVFACGKLFVMAAVTTLDDGRRAWLISHAAGNLRSLVSVMPFPLEYIAFHRRGDRRLRIYPTARLIALAQNQTSTLAPQTSQP